MRRGRLTFGDARSHEPTNRIPGQAANARTAQRLRRDHFEVSRRGTQDDGPRRRVVGSCSRTRTYAESVNGVPGCAHELGGGGNHGLHGARPGQRKEAQQRGIRCLLANAELIVFADYSNCTGRRYKRKQSRVMAPRGDAFRSSYAFVCREREVLPPRCRLGLGFRNYLKGAEFVATRVDEVKATTSGIIERAHTDGSSRSA